MKRGFRLLHDLRISIDASPFFLCLCGSRSDKKSEKTNGMLAAKTGILSRTIAALLHFMQLGNENSVAFSGLIETICSGAGWAEPWSKYVCDCCEQWNEINYLKTHIKNALLRSAAWKNALLVCASIHKWKLEWFYARQHSLNSLFQR